MGITELLAGMALLFAGVGVCWFATRPVRPSDAGRNTPLSLQQVINALAITLMPVVVLITACAAWIVWRVSHSYRDALLMVCLAGIPLLAILLATGFNFYRKHPLVGLLTTVCLLALFPISHDSTGADPWQFAFGLVSGLGGGALTIAFLGFSIGALRARASNNSQEAL